MIDVLNIKNFTSEDYALSFCAEVKDNVVQNWLLFGQLPENPVAIPTAEIIHITPNAKNRYLQSVTMLAVPALVSTATIAIGATATYTLNQAKYVEVSNDAVATVTLTNEVLSITGVAAGSTIITIKNANKDTIATITITVS